jgi:hypothetical protein
MVCEQLNKESDINAKRSAFVMYVEEGIEIVQEYFPEQLKYVEASRHRTLREVLIELQVELKSISNN